MESIQKSGGHATVFVYPGEGHAFMNSDPDSYKRMESEPSLWSAQRHLVEVSANSSEEVKGPWMLRSAASGDLIDVQWSELRRLILKSCTRCKSNSRHFSVTCCLSAFERHLPGPGLRYLHPPHQESRDCVLRTRVTRERWPCFDSMHHGMYVAALHAGC